MVNIVFRAEGQNSVSRVGEKIFDTQENVHFPSRNPEGAVTQKRRQSGHPHTTDCTAQTLAPVVSVAGLVYTPQFSLEWYIK